MKLIALRSINSGRYQNGDPFDVEEEREGLRLIEEGAAKKAVGFTKASIGTISATDPASTKPKRLPSIEDKREAMRPKTVIAKKKKS